MKIQDLCSTDIVVAVPVLSAIVGLFGAVTLIASVCRRRESEGREIPFVSYYHTDDI